jgi:hypothetical protein
MGSGAAFDTFLSITMIAVAALIWGGVWLLRRGNDRKRAILMLAAAGVLFANVLLWSWP